MSFEASALYGEPTNVSSTSIRCRCTEDYQLLTKCVGHSGCICHIDWTLPISLAGSKLHGKMIIQAVDESGNLLYWDPKTGGWSHSSVLHSCS